MTIEEIKRQAIKSARKVTREDLEEAIRQDERNKFITLLKSDLETLDLSDYDNSQVLENYAIKDYIEKTIELLEKEQ